MQASHQRKIASGAEYDYLFPKANGKEKTLKWDANVQDTLDFIPKIVYKTLSDTKALSKLLKGASIYETCNNIWDFVYNHIQYHHDEEGVEQLRRPARAWMDRVRGVDCDCYTVFISSILTNLNIPHSYRITKYKNKTYFQHIYPIVPIENGKHITIDCVIENFNYEEPFTQKKDTPMNLSYLNGIEPEEENSLMAVSPNSDLKDLPDFQDFDGFGKINIGNALKKVAHAANKGNPAAVLLRLGVLASMKLNLFQIPKNLKYAYLTDEQVKEENLDVTKIAKLRKVLTKMEDVFYGAGGDKANLKKAMLSGKGNKSQDVKGIDEYDMDTPLRQLLSGIYEDEFVDATKEVNGLGDPATGTAIAAATTVLAAIAAVIKGIGSVKKGGAQNVDANGNPINTPAVVDDQSNQIAPNTTAPTNTRVAVRKANLDLAKTGDTTPAPDPVTDPPVTFIQKSKEWMKDNPIKTTMAGVALASVIVFGAIELHKHHHKTHHPTSSALSGAPKHNRKKKRGKKHKKAAIALL